MRLITITIIAAFAAASVALAGGSHLITKSAIGKGKLGETSAAYRAAYGKPQPAEQLEGGLARVEYPGQVDVYFKVKGGWTSLPFGSTGGYIVTAGAAFKTAAGVGPCSTASAVKSAYGEAVKVNLAGGEYAYRLGTKLWFEIEGGKVAAVALGADKQAAWIASNTVPCGS